MDFDNMTSQKAKEKKKKEKPSLKAFPGLELKYSGKMSY